MSAAQEAKKRLAELESDVGLAGYSVTRAYGLLIVYVGIMIERAILKGLGRL